MATNNPGKLREARAIAGDNLEILSLNDIGFNGDIEETADTLEGNALVKVRAIKGMTDLDVFADDTGLMVDALGGAPGVYSARYAGEGCDPEANINLLLENLKDIEDRRARFRTCIALSLGGEEHLFEGSVEGRIAKERSGSHGFGYDPIFISQETGKCFAEMSEEDKNAISHRGRAISAMMKWLTALCFMCCAILSMNAASSSSDWTLYNTFDNKIENVFDTPDKTYFLVQAQTYNTSYVDTNKKLCFLFARDKQTEEIRPLNAQNFLSGSVIRLANYNANKNYLLIVYDDLMIDILYDDGKLYTIHALKSYDSPSSKEVRSISFDPENDRAYLATDFGFVAVNDAKYEVAMSGIYDTPIDYVARMGNRLLVAADGKLLCDDADSNHLSFSDFHQVDWLGDGVVLSMAPLSSTKCVVAKKIDKTESLYLIAVDSGDATPVVTKYGDYYGATYAENKDGLFVSTPTVIAQLRRTSSERQNMKKRSQDVNSAIGSWDMQNFSLAVPRGGFCTLRMGDDGEWIQTSQLAMPNVPSAFRSNNLFYSPRHGMLVNSHGIDQNFDSHNANNPILLSSLKDGEWTPMGLPYLLPDNADRLINPCGMAQDPDDPDIFYFGSVANGLMRYNVKDPSTLLHMTRSTDQPGLSGHVSLRDPHLHWKSVFMMLDPTFDKKGNLFVSHVVTDSDKDSEYTAELWVWTPEKRKASVSPETFQPFKVIKFDELTPSKSALILPLEASGLQNVIAYFMINKYSQPFVLFDHNGTPEDESDDRRVVIKSLFDSDGSVEYNYINCALVDPATGLVWVGTNKGVFTFNPTLQFSNPGSVNRIKVSRNDGTSLADYLLDGISINHISIDGNGRKWFALNGGGLVCTSADGRTIIDEITTDNSILPSDNVYATCYNPERNSLMVASEGGLAEYHFSGQNDASGSEVRAYPNPVRPDYYGWVTIDGLEDDCIVKIADSAGNIIREIGPASGGKVQWDACNVSLDRVASGVYFVLASSGPGGGSYSEVAKILVVKN